MENIQRTIVSEVEPNNTQPNDPPKQYLNHVNTVNEVYKNYYQKNIKTIKCDVRITQDNKVMVYDANLAGARLKKLKNTVEDIVTLDEYLHYTPKDTDVLVHFETHDDKDCAYRVIHACEEYKPKTRYSYMSHDPKFCKQIQCMKRQVFHMHDSFDTLDTYYKNICIKPDMLQDTDRLTVFEKVYVYGVHQDIVEALKQQHPWVAGWIVDY